MPALDTQDTQLVYKVREYTVRQSHKTVLFFCPFGIPSWTLNAPGLPIWRLRRNGYSVIAYSYTTAIATHSVQLTVANIDAMLADAEQRIAAMPAGTEIICFGTSMGTVLAANIATRHANIKKVILNLSYADISDHIVALPSIRTIPSRKLQAYLDTAGSVADLRAAFEPYSPLSLTDQFHGKRLLLFSSRNDRVLQQVHTAKFRTALDAAGIDLEYYQNSRGGHYFAALVNYLRYTRWINFLRIT
jgi:predicted esterase